MPTLTEMMMEELPLFLQGSLGDAFGLIGLLFIAVLLGFWILESVQVIVKK